jgi:hypothetical protein
VFLDDRKVSLIPGLTINRLGCHVAAWARTVSCPGHLYALSSTADGRNIHPEKMPKGSARRPAKDSQW